MHPIDILLRLSPFAGRSKPSKAFAGQPLLPAGSLDVLEKLPTGVFLMHPDGHFIYTNRALAHLLGYARTSDLPADPDMLYVDPHERRDWLTRLEAEGAVYGLTVRMRRKDEGMIWAELNVFAVYDKTGSGLYYEGALTDITARVQTETALQQITNALRESEARYVGLFENSPVALWEEDFSAVKDYIDALRARGVTDFKTFLAHSPEAVDDCLRLVRVDDVNLTTLRFYHADTKGELFANLGTILGPEAHDIFYEELQMIAMGETTFESEGQNRTIDGDVMDIFLRWAVAPGYEDSYGKVFVSTIDITERKRIERRERARAERAAALAQMSRAMLEVGLDSDAVYTAIVRRVAALLGDACALALLADDGASVNMVAFRHVDRRAQRRLMIAFPTWPAGLGEKILRQVIETGESVYLPEVSPAQLAEIAPPTTTNFGLIFNLRSLIIAPLGPPGAVIGVLGALRERPGAPFTPEDLTFMNNLAGYTALTILNAQVHDLVRRQAQTDAMTGLYNRSYFIRLAEIEFERSRRYGHPLSAVMIDLDHFKLINDAYGHPAGDQVLTGVVQRCRTITRAFDIFGRFGGEEFMILMPETELDGAVTLAERLRQAVDRAPFEINEQTIRVTVSLGVAAINNLTPTLPALLAQADAAMYAAKHGGRNRVAR